MMSSSNDDKDVKFEKKVKQEHHEDASNFKKRRDKKGFRKPNNSPRQVKFEGDCEDLAGHIYECSNIKQADIFIATTKKIAIHVSQKYTYGSDIKKAVENLKVPILAEPADIPESSSNVRKRILEKKIDEFVKRELTLEENVKKLYSLVWGQCSDAMKSKIEALDDYEIFSADDDGVELLKAIKGIAFNFESQKYMPHALHEAKRRFYIQHQGKFMTSQQYLEQFQNTVDVIKHCGGNVGQEPKIIRQIYEELNITKEDASAEEIKKVEDMAQERYLATAFILGADRNRYGRLIENLENSFVQGQNHYPRTLNSAYNVLTNWRQDPKNIMKIMGPANDGIAFANINQDKQEGTTEDQDEITLNNNGNSKKTITCHRCGAKGHYANQCTAQTHTETGVQLLMNALEQGELDEGDCIGFQFLLNSPGETEMIQPVGDYRSVLCKIDQTGKVPKTWMLLDSQSTVDIVYNPSILNNIRTSNSTMKIHCNAGQTETNLIGDLPGYGTVWYHPEGIANILSLAKVKEKFHVTYDSTNGNEFVVHKGDGSVRRFKQSPRGLYYLDMKKEHAKNPTGTVLINTVDDIKSKYTNRDYSQALKARRLQRIIGRPSLQHYTTIVNRNQLQNCPISAADIRAAEDIFGKDVGIIKGKQTRIKVPHVRIQNMAVPYPILKLYKNIVIEADIMYINGIAFFVTVSRKLHFCTAEMLQNRKSKTIINAVTQVKSLYNSRGFTITDIAMDGEFEPLSGELADLEMQFNPCARDEHVPAIERQIRTIKERTRCIFNTLPFKKLPRRMIIEMVYNVIFWLNAFPHRDGVSDTISPRTLMTGKHIDFNKHCSLEFGEYVQAHEEHDNSMATRATGAIALRPSGNDQGGFYFYSLSTGRRLHRSAWTPLNMPNEVIARVHTLARRDKASNGLTYADRNGQPLYPHDEDTDPEASDSDDDSYEPISETDDDLQDTLAPGDVYIAGVGEQMLEEEQEYEEHQEHEEQIQEDEQEDEHQQEDEQEYEQEEQDQVQDQREDEQEYEQEEQDQVHDQEQLEVYEQEEQEQQEQPHEGQEHPEEGEQEEHAEENIDIATTNTRDDTMNMDQKYGERTTRYNLRPRRPRDYAHLHATLESIVMTQMSAKQGLKKFGKRGVAAIMKELKQLHTRKVAVPRNAKKLTREERKAALKYLMFLKEKRCGTIKARGCADGRKQRETIAKEEASAPTVCIESVMITSVIDAMEGRDVATVDIPGAFMQADQDELIHMKLEGEMAELYSKLDPKLYRKYIQVEKGKSVLYVELKKALYGTLRAALLFWKKLSSKLKSWGFVTNPYDWCVANKDINGEQCTIVWHVDDLKISHKDPKVVTQIISLLDAEFATAEAPLTKRRGKVHDYLGMVLDFSKPGKVMVSMIEYIKKLLNEVPPDMDGEAVTPAANHLFEVNTKNPILLDEETAELFHHYTAKLLFLSKRARPDIQTAVSFLCTRVKQPDTDDYKKLSRVIKYLRTTVDMPLTLEADNMNIIKWWVDASHAVHPDMRSHTGAIMTLGKGAVYATSTRQKLNTKSTTESELVGVDDIMGQALWSQYFIEAQGYSVNESLIYQDNQSAILLEKNGRGSSSKRTRHINIRYFFVTDRINSKEVRVEYCPTKEMKGDFFTKPLQGTPFRKFRDEILNLDPNHGIKNSQDCRSVLNNKQTNGLKKKNKVTWDNNPYSILMEEEDSPEMIDVNKSPTRQITSDGQNPIKISAE